MTTLLLLLLFIIAFSILIFFILVETDEIYEDAYGTHYRLTQQAYDGHSWWIIEYDTAYGTWHHYIDYKYEYDQLRECNDMFDTKEEAKRYLENYVKWVNEQKKASH